MITENKKCTTLYTTGKNTHLIHAIRFLEGFTEDGEPIIGSQTLQQSLGMTDEEADAAHFEGLKNEFIRPKRDKLLAECGLSYNHA